MLKQASNIAKYKNRDSLCFTQGKHVAGHKKVDIFQLVVFSTSFSSQYRDICSIVQKHIALLTFDPALAGVLDP